MPPSELPLIYSDKYNITLYGFEKLHPFDTEKYAHVFNYIKEKFDQNDLLIYEPQSVENQELEKVHTNTYLESLKKPSNVARIAELPLLSTFSGNVLEEKILIPMKYATGGTVMGVDLAIKYQFAINLAGGYHHAKKDEAEGFCYFADIDLAILYIKEALPDSKILIVDLDAHQGNGYEINSGNDPKVFIFDLFNEEIFPMDFEARQNIDFAFPVKSSIKDEEYLNILEKELPKALDKVNPGFIIYNAGTDIYANDPLGDMKISAEGIVKRDEFVFRQALNRNIPLLKVLSGGYTPESSGLIAKSIENLLVNLFGYQPVY